MKKLFVCFRQSGVRDMVLEENRLERRRRCLFVAGVAVDFKFQCVVDKSVEYSLCSNVSWLFCLCAVVG